MGSLPDGDRPLLGLSRGLDEIARKKSQELLGHIEPLFRKIGLQITADTANELIETLRKPAPGQNFQWLIDQIDGLEKLGDKELRGKLFLYIPAEQAKYWPTQTQQFPFGETVADRFPSANFDIGNSGHAIAVELPTAAVFHLMRVLEIGLTALGKVFAVSLAYTNWEPALAQIESKIANMRSDPVWKALPDCKEQQEYYSQAVSYLRTVKDAWRNYTMHTRGKYDNNEAEQIFTAVKGFMQKLAERSQE